MEISKQLQGGVLELRLQGRLDAYWSDHLNHALDEAVRTGNHRIDLDLAGINYISSAGIRVLLKFYKQLQSIKGTFGVVAASDNVRSVLEMSGLAEILVQPRTTPASASATVPGIAGRTTTTHANLEIYSLNPDAKLDCRLSGDPAKMKTGHYTADDAKREAFPDGTFGLGLGAFGSDFTDCQKRFGEFLALGGAAAYLPTDGSNVPDYVVTTGTMVPEINALYSLTAHGHFSHLVRFDTRSDAPGAVPLGELLTALLDLTKADALGVILLVESAGLVGASLQRSPAGEATKDSTLSFPAVRDWLMFTTERAFDRTLCAIAGIAVRQPGAEWQTVLRPIGAGPDVAGHFHAAVFPYRPLPRGEIHLHSTVRSLFGSESIESVLHLLADDRKIDGVGQSEFWRGACWVAPISQLTRS